MHPELKKWARTHVFRTWTAIAALLVLAAAFLFSPELLTWYLRTTMGLIEKGSDLLPYPWGDRIEIVSKSIGGHVWFQVALAIIAVRVAAWILAVCWRHRPTRQK